MGLGNAETKVVATAWNRHLLMFHNGNKYNARSWAMQVGPHLPSLALTSPQLPSVALTCPHGSPSWQMAGARA